MARAKNSTGKRTSERAEAPAGCPGGVGHVTPEADLIWLIHRAAQKIRAAMEEQVASHGLDVRAFLVLKALGAKQKQTQLALGNALGLDKTTLTLLLDRLEKDGLVVRRADPNDRRARIPESTAAGRMLLTKISRAVNDAEQALLADLTETEQRALRVMLCQIISAGDGSGSLTGSCM